MYVYVCVCVREVHACQVIEILVLAKVSRYRLERLFVLCIFVCVYVCLCKYVYFSCVKGAPLDTPLKASG